MNPKIYEKMFKIRKAENLRMKPLRFLREKILYKGKEVDFALRNYQTQMVFHTLLAKRFVIGDDTGLGKTLEGITTIAALWEKDPDLKVIIVTNTSVMKQWGGEIDKFTQGIGWRICQGGPAKRADLYEDYFENWDDDEPEVLITNYHRFKRDKRVFRQMSQGHRIVYLLDECFDYHTPVTLADGSTELIGKIVSKKLDVEVMSYNFETGQVEPKKVVNWFRKKRRATKEDPETRELLRIAFNHGKSVRCTPNHDFYRKDGKKLRARDLKEGSKVLHYVENPATEDQIQVILGGLLGDGCISHPDRGQPGIQFCQGESQKDYLQWKYDILNPLGLSKIRENPSGFKTSSKVFSFRVKSHPHITEVLKDEDLYKFGKMRLTYNLLDRIEPLGLAVWYADDGSLNTHTTVGGETRYNIQLHTQGFTHPENELIAGWLKWKWGVEAQVKFTPARTEGEVYSFIYLPHEEAVKFLELLPGSFPGVEYKFPDKEVYTREEKFLPSIAEDLILSIETVSMGKKEKYVYDIEVEGNHNYFAGGTLVSNCTALKNPESQAHNVFRELSLEPETERVYGLTATLIKNNLLEGFGIYRVVVPDLFRTYTGFLKKYCVAKLERIPGKQGKRWVVKGHRPDQIAAFREAIDPYYLGRSKMSVADELPVLESKDISIPMEHSQYEYYKEAIEGLLTINVDSEEEEEIEVSKLTSLIYCQEIANSPYLIGNEIKSGKEDYFLELLTEEYAGEKVIVFTRFKSMVNRLQDLLSQKKYGYSIGIEPGPNKTWEPRDASQCEKGLVRITGDESAEARDAGRRAFTETDNTNLIFLTMAGAEAINLQQSKIMIFYDLPWSAGDYLQLIGRMIRIGSPHERVLAIHLLSETPQGEKAIDHHVLSTLQTKMGYIEQALGERLVKGSEEKIRVSSGSGNVGMIPVSTSEVSDLFDLLVNDAKGKKS